MIMVNYKINFIFIILFFIFLLSHFLVIIFNLIIHLNFISLLIII